MVSDALDFKVSRIHKLANDGNILAFVDLSVNDGLLIKGFRIVKGPHGVFVTMPQEKGKNNRWYNTVFCLSKEIQTAVVNCVLSAYQEEGDSHEKVTVTKK